MGEVCKGKTQATFSFSKVDKEEILKDILNGVVNKACQDTQYSFQNY